LKHSNDLQKGEGIRMKKNLSKKQLGAVGLAAMMAVQTPAMAAEVTTSPEATVQETAQEQQEEVTELQTEEVETQDQTVESSLEENETQAQEEETVEIKESVEVETSESAKQEESQSEEIQPTEETEAESQSEEVQSTEESTEIEAESSENENAIDEYVLAANLTDGWHQDSEGNYTYVKDGRLLTNCVEKIGGSYYGFDWYGKMYANTIFSSLDPTDKVFYFYRASKSGALYANQWYSGEDAINYYGENAKICTGLQTINGIQYLFDSKGALISSQIVLVDDTNYYCDTNGVAHKMPNNQWYKSDNGVWYYVQDGKLLKDCTAQIDGKWYHFEYYGELQTDGLNTDASGALRINSWVYDGTYWHYYGEDGEAYRYGVYEISDAKYYFDMNSRMAVSEVCTDDGVGCYIADKNGQLTQVTKDGWFLFDGDYYYVENGQLKTNGAYKINGSWYAFGYTGKMCVDSDFNGFGSSLYYRAKADGKLYCSEWYQDENKNWYYYKEDASMARGTTKIGETTYYFDVDGVLKANGAVEVGTSYRLADENGSWIQTPGWVCVSESWYYVLNDGTLYTGILEENGATYYLSPKMAKNAGLLDVDGVAYQIAENGLATKAADGFYTGDVLNHLYYVSDGRIATKGWLNVDGNWYYFEEKDYLGIYYAVAGTNETIDGKLYHFNSDGTMASQGWGLYEDGSWYYASASGELSTGDVTLGGTAYHFDENGKLQSGLVVENGICKLYSENGILQETGNAQGWSLLGGNYYYLKDGALLKNVSRRLSDGKWYGFDATGKMRTNIIADGRFYGKTGAAQTGWFTVAGKWYYASSVNALLKTGLHVINGAEYYFDRNGTMQTGEFVVNGKLFTTNENGVVLSKTTMKNGWTNCQGSWYYYQNGIAYTGFVGAYYVIDGKMVSNRIVEWKGKRYYVGEDGKYLVNTWCNDGYSYATEDGSLVCSEWKTIDGKQYYFYWEGVLYPYFYYGKGVYTKEGAYLSPDGYAQGWQLIDGIYYYKEGNQFIRNQSKKIKGDWYLFDAHGNMVTGFSSPEIIGYDTYTYDDAKFYYGADGKRVNYTGWQVIDGNWYYFNSKSEAVDGWNIINGTKYYFGKTNHFMYTGYKVISGDLYYFNGSGACQGLDNTFTGWHQQDGDWYYIQKGHVTTGTIAVDGRLYGFDSNGVWIAD
jgi:glucan-binding YG repeat protein